MYFYGMARISRKERYKRLISYFSEVMPDAGTELEYRKPYELIVAVLLSAQCTDKRVNMITPDFFKRFPDPESLAAARQQEVLELIRSCSYPNSKSKHLIGMANVLVNEFHNQVPADVDELQKLPGIGRKSANVIAAVIHSMPVMPVDTHVFRVSARIGLTIKARSPLQAEKQLVANLPEYLIPRAHHWLILHGRYTCTARKPRCHECGLRSFCKHYNDNQ
jgi:endonuclease-3